MGTEHLTIIDKKYLEKLENWYNNTIFNGIEALQIQDIENLDTMLPSVIKLLKDAWLVIKEERSLEKDHEKSLELIGAMNILKNLATVLEQNKMNEYREQIQKHKENLEK